MMYAVRVSFSVSPSMNLSFSDEDVHGKTNKLNKCSCMTSSKFQQNSYTSVVLHCHSLVSRSFSTVHDARRISTSSNISWSHLLGLCTSVSPKVQVGSTSATKRFDNAGEDALQITYVRCYKQRKGTTTMLRDAQW